MTGDEPGCWSGLAASGPVEVFVEIQLRGVGTKIEYTYPLLTRLDSFRYFFAVMRLEVVENEVGPPARRPG